MRLTGFRITNFRSIVDSRWVPFSPDGITVLVGQNESGKTSVLEALHLALAESGDVSSDDFRIGAPLPSVSIRAEIAPDEVEPLTSGSPTYAISAFRAYLAANKNVAEVVLTWKQDTKDGKVDYVAELEMASAQLADAFVKAKSDEKARVEELAQQRTNQASQSAASEDGDTSVIPPEQSEPTHADSADEADIDPDDVAVGIWQLLPSAILFNEATGHLPNRVDIDEKGQPTGPGAKAALNFLQIADIDLPELLRGDTRVRQNLLNRANSKLSQDFNAFWSQTIGKSGRLSLKCDISNYPSSAGEKSGKPHLVFWISDGVTQLYPKQRSQGVRWFVSFYLQLKASEKNRQKRLFLLDEPGANLHARAQADVLKLINRLGKDISTVVYSTHSPQMVEYPKLFRVHAVQRTGDLDDSPTEIIDAHRLGTASTDTLSPVLTAMGSDLSHHQVIRKDHNVILEEMSGFYYLTAFWKLTGTTTRAHFIAATGVNKVELLANMFRGWGLDFVVAVDDDKQGREVFKRLKEELCGNEEALAAAKLLKFPGCPSIEDVFSHDDFKKYVLQDESATFSTSNAEFLKSAGRSKPVMAFNFALAVDREELTLPMLSTETQNRIRQIVEALTTLITKSDA